MFVKFFLFALGVASVAATGASVQLYSDSDCNTAVGEPLNVPLPFSEKCQPIQSSPPMSIVFNCVPDGANTNFTLQIYNGTADCSGAISVGIVSDDTTDGCAKTTITAEGQSQTAYSHIKCDASTHAVYGAQPMAINQAQESIDDIIDFVSDFHKGAEFKSVKYHDDGSFRHRAKFVNKIHH